MNRPTNILITGASRGIGYDTALELAKNPDNQLFLLSRNTKRLETIQKKSNAAMVHIITADLANLNAADLQKNFANIEKIDVLINNAGKLINKPFSALSLADWQDVFAVNLFGVVQLIKFIFPLLEKATKAHIVNIGSMGGVQGSSKFPGLSAYSASKAALANLTECLAEEFKDLNIYSNCLALGAVQTEMLEEAFPGYEAPVTSATMATYVAWFALNGHHFHNGKIIPVAINTP